MNRTAPVSAEPRSTGHATRARLIDAAGEVFAERGFRATTIRAICVRAGANVAAVNYHFRDKSGLYAAVLVAAHRSALEKYPPDFGIAPGAGPRDQLRAFVRSMLLRMRDPGRSAWQLKLMTLELAAPTAALDEVVRTGIRPMFERLSAIVRALLPASSPDAAVRLAAASVVGQCLFWTLADPVVRRLPPLRNFARGDATEVLADHIVRFSLAALAPSKRERRP